MTTTYLESWSAGTSLTAANISGQSIQAGKDYAGGEYDNSAAGAYDICDIVLAFQLAATAAAGAPIYVKILYALDGTNYEDGIPGTNDGTAAASPTQFPSSVVGVVGALADTSLHRVSLRNIPLLPFKFKVVLSNGTAVNSASPHFSATLYGKHAQSVG